MIYYIINHYVSGLTLLTKYIPLGPLQSCTVLYGTALIHSMVRQVSETNAYSTFLLGLKAPETRRQWPKRLKFFLDYVEIAGNTIEERANLLYDIIQKDGSLWLQKQLMDFVLFQKQRVENNEISESIISNCFKPIKLFWNMNSILVNWEFEFKVISIEEYLLMIVSWS